MSETNYAGINYAGRTNTNKNAETGIRYGVIHQNELNPDALTDIFDDGINLTFEDIS